MKNKIIHYFFKVIKGNIFVKMKIILMYLLTYFQKHDTKDPIGESE